MLIQFYGAWIIKGVFNMSCKGKVRLDELLENYSLHIEKEFYDNIKCKYLIRTEEDRDVGMYGITVIEVDISDSDTGDITMISSSIENIKECMEFDNDYTANNFYEDIYEIARLTYLYY